MKRRMGIITHYGHHAGLPLLPSGHLAVCRPQVECDLAAGIVHAARFAELFQDKRFFRVGARS